MEISFLTVLGFIWLHFLMDYIINPEFFIVVRSNCEKNYTDYVYINNAFFYAIPFMMFGTWFGGVLGIAYYFLDWASYKVLSVERRFLHSKCKPYFLKISRGLDQILHLTLLFVIYELMEYYDCLGYRIL